MDCIEDRASYSPYVLLPGFGRGAGMNYGKKVAWARKVTALALR
jgi:hypothetical protein